MATTDTKKTRVTSATLEFKRILVPTDFSKTSLLAVRRAKTFARRFDAAIVLLHVIEKAPFISDMGNVAIALSDKEMVERAAIQLNVLARREFEPEIPFETKVKFGRPFQEINESAKTLKADLIVISTHGYTGLKHTLLGSTAERVVRHAPCDVLVVRSSG
jgi:universal stress protein A